MVCQCCWMVALVLHSINWTMKWLMWSCAYPCTSNAQLGVVQQSFVASSSYFGQQLFMQPRKKSATLCNTRQSPSCDFEGPFRTLWWPQGRPENTFRALPHRPFRALWRHQSRPELPLQALRRHWGKPVCAKCYRSCKYRHLWTTKKAKWPPGPWEPQSLEPFLRDRFWNTIQNNT